MAPHRLYVIQAAQANSWAPLIKHGPGDAQDQILALAQRTAVEEEALESTLDRSAGPTAKGDIGRTSKSTNVPCLPAHPSSSLLMGLPPVCLRGGSCREGGVLATSAINRQLLLPTLRYKASRMIALEKPTTRTALWNAAMATQFTAAPLCTPVTLGT